MTSLGDDRVKECRFNDEVIFEGRYQLCSCGKHVWSTRAHKVLNQKTDRPLMLTVDDQGSRVPWDNSSMSIASCTERQRDDTPDTPAQTAYDCTSMIIMVFQLCILMAVIACRSILSEKWIVPQNL
jgi:hypothetical protein